MTRITNLGWKRKYLNTSKSTEIGSTKAGDTEPVGSDAPLARDLSARPADAVTMNMSRKPSQKDKGDASEKRRQKRIAQRHNESVCYACRETGHTALSCPTKSAGTGPICYRCGSKKHRLGVCKAPEDPDNPLPYASCFVCNGTGHIASSCPDNPNGVYPKGGCCRLCGLKTHLVKDCPVRQTPKGRSTEMMLDPKSTSASDIGADEDDFHILKRRRREVEEDEHREERAEKRARIDKSTAHPVKKAKVVKF